MSDLVQQMADTLDTDEAEAGRRLMNADWPERQPKKEQTSPSGEPPPAAGWGIGGAGQVP